MICIEWEKGKLTNKEALNNLGELVQGVSKEGNDLEHYLEVYEKILDKEVPISNTDEELEKNWHEETHED